VSDARELLAAYLRQREELGEPPLVLDGPPEARARTPGAEPTRERPAAAESTSGQSAAPPTAPDASPGRASPPVARRTRAARKAGEAEAPEGWRRRAPAIPAAGITVERPAKDLFSSDPLASMTLEELAVTVRACTKCVLCRERTNAVPGEGPADARLVVVGEGPGATEDETGRPFVGRAGKLLTEILAAIELPREQVYICNVVKCRPPGNRKPQQDEIDACVPYLYRQLDRIAPKVILAMGNTAAETLLNTKQSLGSLRGRVHHVRGMPVIVTYHPAALLRNPHWKKPTWDDVRIARQLLDA
jgi:uracil-DNA glycosylase